jgi:hypothetical protein
MGLNLPTVTVTPGPTWANNVNSAFSVVDSHNHSSGAGVQIPTTGININADLSFNGYNATTFRSVRLQSQASVLGGVNDLSCLYAVSGNLYYNSGAGQQIQLTIGGALNATSIGGIGGDYSTSTASVSYSSASQTFTFWQSSGTSAYIDCGPLKLHAIGNANAVTFGANASMSSGYTLTLPVSLPAVQSFMTLDASGNIAAPWTVDNSTIKVISNQLVASVSNLEHGWELNGAYASLTYPQNNIDATFFASYAITLASVFIYSSTNGTTGITEFDLKYKTSPSGTFASIFSTTGKIASTTALAIGAIQTTGAVSPYTATVTTTLPHGFIAGDSITIAGVTPAAYNGTWTVTGVPTTTSLTFSIVTTQGASTVGGTLATRTLAYTDSGSVVAAQAGITKPVLSVTSIPAGSIIRFDLLTSMNTGATDARIRMYYKAT